ncbi:hypothetical protein PQX77_003996 [Marasmius sp. AFHP31]|nr:hypothetical protein PQX77_003996 [Marasmius sp. AFHP31]
MMSIENTHTGSGPQNNNHAGTQHIHYDGQIGHVSGGKVNFVKHFNTTVSNPHKNLWDSIAGVGASHKAEHQFSRGECLEGTRERALVAIHDWASAKEPEALPICWLSGPAGVGKSAIALTIAQSFERLSLLASSFFFFRSDPKRNNPSALVLTIAHELATTSSLMRNCIEHRISTDPKILEARLEEQFRELIIAPVLAWSRQRSLWGAPVVPNIVIIDGLDECGDEETQLRVLSIVRSAYQQTPHFPLRFLICSRPEAWIREDFADEPLFRLSKNIILGDSPEDIRRYYVHHFQEIVTSRRYRHVRFPSPWPSERELEILVWRSGGQFIYAATVIKFVKLAYNHPIEQLLLIFDNTLERQPSKSPYHDLDCLYHIILSGNPNHAQLLSILAAILILPKDAHVSPAPMLIEMVLGLPAGQVDLALRGMHSVLDISECNDSILPYHASLSEYLVDQTRSCDFHIDMPSQKHVIAHLWLRNLQSPSKVRSSSSDEFLQRHYFSGWIWLCSSIPQPTRDLLDDIWSVDLANVFSSWTPDDRHLWRDVFVVLVQWMEKYPHHAEMGHNSNQSKKNSGDKVYDRDKKTLYHAKFPNPICPPYDTVERGVHGFRRAADEWSDSDLVEALIYKLQNLPRCFHLEWLQDIGPQHIPLLHQFVQDVTECPEYFELGAVNIDWGSQRPMLLSECHCDISGGYESHDPKHVAYQDACLQCAKALTSKLAEMVSCGTTQEMAWIFRNLVDSALLKHCRLDTELFSLCQTFFELVQGSHVFDWVRDNHGGATIRKERASLLDWIETFPEKFAEEGKALKAQVRALPWLEWEEDE